VERRPRHPPIPRGMTARSGVPAPPAWRCEEEADSCHDANETVRSALGTTRRLTSASSPPSGREVEPAARRRLRSDHGRLTGRRVRPALLVPPRTRTLPAQVLDRVALPRHSIPNGKAEQAADGGRPQRLPLGSLGGPRTTLPTRPLKGYAVRLKLALQIDPRTRRSWCRHFCAPLRGTFDPAFAPTSLPRW